MGFDDGGTEGYFKAVGGALSRLGFMFYMLHDALLSYALYSTLFFVVAQVYSTVLIPSRPHMAYNNPHRRGFT